jgi:2-polyprenyl-6-hydroxyphenyl methylase/3-demethylubiquinone-9 3-methyltransferase
VTNFDPAEIARFDATASRWWDADGDMRPLHDLNPIRLEYVERAGPLAGKTIVDVGCGGGLLAEAMARKGGNVLGIDLASELLDVARLHAMQEGVAVDYQRLSAEALAEARPGGFELVTCMEMLEHVPDPATVIGALARLVKPGGDVIVSTLNRTPRAYFFAVLGAEYVLRILPTGTHSYEKFIRPSELAQWARDAGLQLMDVAGLDYDPFTRHARLTNDARVNYLVHLRRPAAGAPAQ